MIGSDASEWQSGLSCRASTAAHAEVFKEETHKIEAERPWRVKKGPTWMLSI